MDWHKLDPRQYDPRRIIKEALTDDLEDAIKPLRADTPQPAPALAPHTPPATGPSGAHAVRPDSDLVQNPPPEVSETHIHPVPQEAEKRSTQQRQ